MMTFIKAYIYSMRLYYAFVTLTAGWAGLSLYEGTADRGRKICILAIMFIGWGVNQIINDYMGRREDAVNAPNRPMVSGKLRPLPAMTLSAAILFLALLFCLFTRPAAIVPAAAGVLLNILYSYMKGYGIAGNLFFGLSISCCAWFGYTAAGGGLADFFRHHSAVWMIIVVLNMMMTSFTYFKDVKGDRAAGKRTIIVQLGPKKAGQFLFHVSFLPVILLGLCGMKTGSLWYILSAIIACALFIRTGFLYRKHFSGEAAYFNLKYNFAALSAAQASLVSLAYPAGGFLLCLISVFSVITLFTLGYGHADE